MAKADKPAQRREGLQPNVVKGETSHQASRPNTEQIVNKPIEMEKKEHLIARSQGIGGRRQ